MSFPPSDRAYQYIKVVATQCLPLFSDRNEQYGDSIVETGVLGAVVELVAKNARLRELVLRAPDHGAAHPKEVADSLRDLVNYGVIGLLMLNENNWTGKERDDVGDAAEPPAGAGAARPPGQ